MNGLRLDIAIGEWKRQVDRIDARLQDASRFGAGRAMLRLMNLVGTAPPTPPVRTGWGRRSMIIAVSGEIKNRVDWERAKSAALQRATSMGESPSKLRAIQATEPPGDFARGRAGVVIGELVMTAPYMTRHNFHLRGTGGALSTRASGQDGGRVGRGFFTDKPLRYTERILRDYVRGIEIYLSAGGGGFPR